MQPLEIPYELAVLVKFSWYVVSALIAVYYIFRAYTIRLHAIQEYGLVIHEFDPWFNFRATQYLADHGALEFFHWYDYMSWYPLGRPIGTTIYPGMQFTSVYLWKLLNHLGIEISLNDVCCYVPAWFGSIATSLLGLLTWECTKSSNASVVAVVIFSMIPAHIMRSVGGGYDNESVAVTCMCLTFYLWCRSLRTDKSWGIGVLTGLAYFYMVATWGGYIFVLNMMAIHALFLVVVGRYSSKLCKAYSLFYIIGTALATRVPVVGMTPLKSLEQLGAFGVLIILWCLEFCEVYRDRIAKSSKKGKFDELNMTALRLKVLGSVALIGAVGIVIILPTGYLGPLSSRVRSLFVAHTRTGNPLVDSVAEHQPSSPDSYWQYLHLVCYVAPFGLVFSVFDRSDQKYFLTLYAVAAYYFSMKMVRLVLLMGPVMSSIGGLGVAMLLEWSVSQILKFRTAEEEEELHAVMANGDVHEDVVEDSKSAAASSRGQKRGKAKLNEKPTRAKKTKDKRLKKNADMGKFSGPFADIEYQLHKVGADLHEVYEAQPSLILRKIAAVVCFYVFFRNAPQFNDYCSQMAQALSYPSIMFKATLTNGQNIIVDDYREAYHWLRDETPEDSRVMSWWDYGYQITGIGNRTTIADGNTWNHEHIALLGRCLTSPVKKAHKIVRHLADYILVWAGGGSDDLGKSPHMARIGTSVYDDICPGDPTCRQYGFLNQQMAPTPMMADSLLYQAHSHGQAGVRLNEKLFREVFSSKYGKVRIYKVMNVSQKSKDWVADPENRVCDAPGSWYCTGQYPPALAKLLQKGKAFKQVEDFNTAADEDAKQHYEEYMKRMSGVYDPEDYKKDLARAQEEKERKKKRKERKKREREQLEEDADVQDAAESAFEVQEEPEDEEPEQDEDDYSYESYDGEEREIDTNPAWGNTPITTHLWELISSYNIDNLERYFQSDPGAVYARSADGRGPLWWAFEYGNDEAIDLLLELGADINARDETGNTPKDMRK